MSRGDRLPILRRVIGILFNPTARGEKALQFRERLSELGSAARVLPTRGPGDARVLAAELIGEGVETVVAAGGDGTVNEVLNGLADVPGALDRTRLALIPLGTVNVLAKELGIPSDFDAAWHVIQRGHERRIDLPHAEFIGLDGHPETRQFALLAGAGLSTRSIEGVDWSLKKRHGQLAYILSGIRAMRPPYPAITVSCADRSVSGPLVEIGSGRYFGGRLELFPGTRVDDGQLGVTVVTRLNWITLIGTWIRMVLGAIRPSAVRQAFHTDQLRLSCAEPMSLHLDGDVVGTLPASITVRPRALRIVVP